MLSIVPVAGQPFGATVTGVDLQQPLSTALRAQLRTAWLDFQVLSFPNQTLNHPQLEAVSLAFGEFGDEPYLRGLPKHPNIVAVERKPEEKPAPFGTSWHTDWSFMREPPSATVLHSKVIPPMGGDTLYANGYLAWEALSDVLKAKTEGRFGLHSARRSYSLAGYEAGGGKARSMNIVPSDNAYRIQRHPLVCTHPETGRKALWVNWVYTIGIEDMPEAEGASLLRALLTHSVRDDFVYRHRWHPDMLTLWDNRCLQHQATGGYDGHHRLMHRTTLKGAQPTA